MVVLTDGSRFASACAGVPAASAGLAPPRVTPIWTIVHGRGDPAAFANSSAQPFWSCLIAVERAERSQFVAMAEAAAAGWIPDAPVASVVGTCAGLRGFHGRTWESREGNLHFAAAIPLDGWPERRAVPLVLLPVLAACDALRAASAGVLDPSIKWVNDVYLGAGKAGGILTRTAFRGGCAELLIVGIGVNVRTAPALPATPFVPAASAAGGVTLTDLLDRLLAALARRVGEARGDRWTGMLEEYRTRSAAVGRRVRIYPDTFSETLPPRSWPAPLARGAVRAIGDDLSLSIEAHPEPVTTGRLAFETDCRAFGLPGD